MKWYELRPGDQLLPYTSYHSSALLHELDPLIVLDVQFLRGDKVPSASWVQETVEITYLNMRTAKIIKESRYSLGTAALGFVIFRDGKRLDD